MITISRDALPRLAATSVCDGHANTVMGVAVATAADRMVSLDYDGVWIARDARTHAELCRGVLDGRGRGVALSPDGECLAALVAMRDHSDTRYAYDVFVTELATGESRRCHGERSCGVAWTPDSGRLIVTGVVGFRLHTRDGKRLRDDESPKGWMAATATEDGERLFFIRRNELHCLAIEGSRPLPAPDVAAFAPPPNAIGADSDGLAVSPAGDRISTGRQCGGLCIWNATGNRSLLVELAWDGPEVFRTKAVFSRDAQYLVASFHHVVTAAAYGLVTHVLYALRSETILGAFDTMTHMNGFHSTATFSADSRRIYVSEGNRIHVCAVPPAE